MKKLAALFFVLTTLSAVMVLGQDPNMVISKVRAKYKDVTDYKADLTLISCSAASGTCHRFEGKVEMKRPNKLRMDIKKPDQQQIVCDGQTLWMYLEKDKQVIRTGLDEARDCLTLLNPLDKLLSGKVKNCSESNGSLVCWLEIPEFKELFKEIKIITDAKTYEIIGLDVVDADDNSSEYSFTKIKTNTGIKDDRFKFNIPKQVKVITAN